MHQPNRPEPHDARRPQEQARSRVSELSHTLRLMFVEILFETLAPAFVIALLINLFVAQSTYVHGTSMEPNLHTDQRLVMEKVSYRLHPPRRGDIVIVDIETSDIPLIKRVIGLPNETVVIHSGRVYVNGELLNEPYINEFCTFRSCEGEWMLGPDEYFVLGDNRSHSLDSHSFGPVKASAIVGIARVRYWPPDEADILSAPEY